MEILNNTLAAIPSNYIDYLVAETKDNQLVISSWNEESEDSNVYFRCNMRWPESLEEFKMSVSKHIENIRKIAVLEEVPEELISFYNTFLKPFTNNFNIGSIDEEESIECKLFVGEPLTDDEKELYLKYRKDIDDQCCARLADNNYSYPVIIRSKRLLRLLKMNAPEVIINHEQRILIEALCLYNFCKDPLTMFWTK